MIHTRSPPSLRYQETIPDPSVPNHHNHMCHSCILSKLPRNLDIRKVQIIRPRSGKRCSSLLLLCSLDPPVKTLSKRSRSSSILVVICMYLAFHTLQWSTFTSNLWLSFQRAETLNALPTKFKILRQKQIIVRYVPEGYTRHSLVNPRRPTHTQGSEIWQKS